MGFCDGSACTISYSIDEMTWQALGNRKDGEVIELD